jgi:asparagine synthase (glutamine-hydrolysing)
MSGIAGLLRHDGRPVERVELERMMEFLAHRGPDGGELWCEGRVGFGHRMLRTTPESLRERLPLVNTASGVALTADARIDNREELISALRLRSRPEAAISDSELVLRTYEKWGDNCAERLIGDFAFAIWDMRRQQLFCARDHYGVKPFYYYHEPHRLFAFASEIKGLLCLPCVPRRIEETWIADYLWGIYQDREITAYQGILRLPPGHTLVITPRRATTRCYWSIDPEREIRYRSDAEYEEAFREVFDGVVRSRLRSLSPVGSTLSGGLDSSSITCVAREQIRKDGGPPLATLSQVYEDTPSCDERQFIRAVLEQGSLAPHFVWCDRVSPVEDAERFLWHLEEPTYAHNLALFWAVTREARAHGLGVLLTGLHGDSTLSYGMYYMADLLRSGQWIALTRAVRSHARNWEASSWWAFKTFAAKPLLPAAALRLWRQAAGRPSPPPEPTRLINPEFARRVGVEHRRRSLYGDTGWRFQSAKELHHLEVTAGITTKALEAADRVAAAFSIELRHPFLDKRLVEFCLALPSDQKFHGGWPRSIIRRALAGVLPEEVRWRLTKTVTTGWYSRTLWASERSRLEQLIREPGQIRPYVDLVALEHAFRNYSTTGSHASARALWEPMMLAAWLQTHSDPQRDQTNKGGEQPIAGEIRSLAAPRFSAKAAAVRAVTPIKQEISTCQAP